MFDLSQLVQIEYITLCLALLFACMGFKYNKPAIGLIVALEFLLTTFMMRHESMSYYAYEGIQEELAWILYNTAIIIAQTLIAISIAYFYKAPLVLFYYACQILINISSFIIGLMATIAPESIGIKEIQSAIDNTIYWYVYWVSLTALVVGIMINGNSGGRGTRIISIYSNNLLNSFGARNKLASIMARIKRRVQNP